MEKHCLFISDIHLQKATPTITNTFINFLHNTAIHADALYILGDLFEFWVGDDDNSDFNNLIISELKNLHNKNVQIFFINGNRDFLIGKVFAQKTNIIILPDPCLINIYNLPILLSHGDILCTKDKRHQTYRKFMNHNITKKILTSLPLKTRYKIASYLRSKSQDRYKLQKNNCNIFDICPIFFDKIMHKYQSRIMIHGHTHIPKVHNSTNELHTRIVLGAWHDNGEYLQIKHNGQYRLHKNTQKYTKSFKKEHNVRYSLMPSFSQPLF